MIHETIEEVRIMLYLIGYGIFCLSSYDTLITLIKTLIKPLKIAISIIYSVSIVYLTYEFSFVLANGYIPIHFILFLLIGFLIYILVRKIYMQGLIYIKEILIKIKRPIGKLLVFLVYPQELIEIIKIPMRMLKDTIKTFIGVLNQKK